MGAELTALAVGSITDQAQDFLRISFEAVDLDEKLNLIRRSLRNSPSCTAPCVERVV